MSGEAIHVLVVDDSQVARELLLHVFESDPRIAISGCAATGEEALALLARHKPDVVTMDIHMPGLDGYETTRRIMETWPVPIVIVSSSYDPEDVAMAFRAMEAGAVAAVEKPPCVTDAAYPLAARKLVSMVKAMAEVRVIRRWPKSRTGIAPDRACQQDAGSSGKPVSAPGSKILVIAIGASTGGPPVLQTVLRGICQPCPPILIVQHICAGFVDGLATWLSKTTGVKVSIAGDGEEVRSGHAYLAPDGAQMRINRRGQISCTRDASGSGTQPSVACLFRSVADAFGAEAIGVLLSGMGRDGADELKLMRERGAPTIAQDKESSIVHGMPGEAVKLGAASYVLPADRIASAVNSLLTGSPPQL